MLLFYIVFYFPEKYKPKVHLEAACQENNCTVVCPCFDA